MIESELKRKRLTDIVTHWCEHTQHRNLRAGDIPGLVDSVLSEFYHITLSCGHMVRDMDEGIPIAFKDFVVDRGDMEHGGGMGEISGDYCKECADRYLSELGAWKVEDVSSKGDALGC